MSSRYRVVLVAPDDDVSRALAAYLQKAGFGVERARSAGRCTAVVRVVAEGTSRSALEAAVRAHLAAQQPHTIIVVTPQPAALEALARRYRGRLHVLPAPAFGWDIVDALRAVRPTSRRPRLGVD
jgi:hypothetical protein